jgi:predicted dehydrogenase
VGGWAVEAVRVGLVGVGRQSDWAHAGAIRHSGVAQIGAICDTDEDRLRDRGDAYGVPPARRYPRWQDLVACPDLDAVVIATPNALHAPVAVAAAEAGLHVLCEKPLALNTELALSMLEAARRHRVRHMTAFTYRFVPSMRYLRHLAAAGRFGDPRIVRSRRLMDFPDTSLGWRQERGQAGSGDLGDMASHRIDQAQAMLGPVRRVQGLTRIFVPERRRPDGGTHRAEVDDWCAFLAEFAGSAVGVFESTKVARGYEIHDRGTDDFELNGASGSGYYRLRTPYTLEIGDTHGSMVPTEVPAEFRAPIGHGVRALPADASLAFRYNQMYAFLDAVRTGAECAPSFLDGARVMAVCDAVLRSQAEGRAVDVQAVE